MNQRVGQAVQKKRLDKWQKCMLGK